MYPRFKDYINLFNNIYKIDFVFVDRGEKIKKISQHFIEFVRNKTVYASD